MIVVKSVEIQVKGKEEEEPGNVQRAEKRVEEDPGIEVEGEVKIWEGDLRYLFGKALSLSLLQKRFSKDCCLLNKSPNLPESGLEEIDKSYKSF